jgi:DNA polymerase III epsilon subunit-like protein
MRAVQRCNQQRPTLDPFTRLAIVDVETTGFSPAENRIAELESSRSTAIASTDGQR